MEQTFALVKSGAVARGQHWRILQAIEEAGFRIARLAFMRPMPVEAARSLYVAHKGRPYYDGLIASVTGEAGTVAMVLEREGAVRAWRRMMGATDPAKAEPGTIRAKFGGQALPDNAVHGSDSTLAALIEADLVLPWFASMGEAMAAARIMDWRAEGGEIGLEEAAKATVTVSRGGYGLELDVATDGGTAAQFSLEVDHGCIHMIAHLPDDGGNHASLRVDGRGIHVATDDGTGPTLLIAPDGAVRDLDGAWWEPPAGPEFDMWIGPWTVCKVEGHAVWREPGRRRRHRVGASEQAFATLADAIAHAKSLPPVGNAAAQHA